ncbi:hypothetical protein EV121DRAFT_297394 [Schizophyllum commune]
MPTSSPLGLPLAQSSTCRHAITASDLVGPHEYADDVAPAEERSRSSQSLTCKTNLLEDTHLPLVLDQPTTADLAAADLPVSLPCPRLLSGSFIPSSSLVYIPMYLSLPVYILVEIIQKRSHFSPDPLLRRSNFIAKTVVWVLVAHASDYELGLSQVMSAGDELQISTSRCLFRPIRGFAFALKHGRAFAFKHGRSLHFKRTLAHFLKRAFEFAVEFAFTLKLILAFLNLMITFLKLILAFLKLLLGLKRTTPTR